MMASQALIEIQQLTKVYRMGEAEVAALGGIDLHIEAGEFIAIMGPSGSGKSTLMNVLGCLDRPTAGRYYLNGEDVSALDRRALARIRNQRIGFIFQSYNLLSRTTALKNVMLPMFYDRNNRLSLRERERKAREALEGVGLGERIVHEPQEMSGGEQQRVAIARALINDPLLILADEPTGNLDTHSGAEIMQILHQLHARGRTIIMVTHDSTVARHTQRIIYLRDGLVERWVQNGHEMAQDHPQLLATQGGIT